MSECWPDDLDCSEATFPSIDRLQLLSLSSFINWINVSKSVASGATVAFFLLSTSLDDNFRSSNWDWMISLASLAESAKMSASQMSTNCRVGVLFPSDMVNFKIEG